MSDTQSSSVLVELGVSCMGTGQRALVTAQERATGLLNPTDTLLRVGSRKPRFT